jgi:hypothetical protein
MFFTAHKPQPQFLPNTYLNPTNHTFFKPQPQKLPNESVVVVVFLKCFSFQNALK